MWVWGSSTSSKCIFFLMVSLCKIFKDTKSIYVILLLNNITKLEAYNLITWTLYCTSWIVAIAILWCSALKCCSNDRHGITDCLKYFIVLAQVRLHVWRCKLNRVEVWGEYGGRKIFQLFPFPLPSLPLIPLPPPLTPSPLPLIPLPLIPPPTNTTSLLCGVRNTCPLQQQNYQHLHQNSASVESGFHEQSLQLTRLAAIIATTIVCKATPTSGTPNFA